MLSSVVISAGVFVVLVEGVVSLPVDGNEDVVGVVSSGVSILIV